MTMTMALTMICGGFFMYLDHTFCPLWVIIVRMKEHKKKGNNGTPLVSKPMHWFCINM